MEFTQWQFPMGPGDPFGNTTLVVLDCLRLFIILCGALTVILTIPAVSMTWSITQKYRLSCIALFAIYVSMTEVQRLGNYANWRLLLGATCVIWSVASLLAFIQFEGNPERAGWLKRIAGKSPKKSRNNSDAG